MPSPTFEAMPTLASESPSSSPPFNRRRKSWARRVERFCCQTASYFPLAFVYGLSTWAVWAEVNVSLLEPSGWLRSLRIALGLLLYSLANISYSLAVFTPPGSPLDPREDLAGRRKGGYEGLPTYEDEEPELPHGVSAVTAKASGKKRYCKKCRTVKPDRTHHCSSCGKCVLKMDHHCPWLATCAGLRNYKPFLLFLIYISLFCWLCFGVSATWVWTEISDEVPVEEGWQLVNTIMLAVLGGIVGLVLSGFTGWHIYLAATGQTTIESLEKTRYLQPVRKSMEHQLQANRNYLSQPGENAQQSLTDQLKEIHANALPGVLRPEEDEDRLSNNTTPSPHPSGQNIDSPARESLHRSYASLEHQRETERYAAYLDEQDSEKLPNAFDLGWKRNLLHVFGEQPYLWLLPVRNTSGDGWQWEVSPKWTSAREEISRTRAQRQREEQQWSAHNPTTFQHHQTLQQQANNWRWSPGQGFVDRSRPPPPPPVTGLAHATRQPLEGSFTSNSANVQMQSLDRRKVKDDDVDSYDTSSDEDTKPTAHQGKTTANWNDVPDDFLAPKGGRDSRSRSRGRKKGD